MKVDKKNIGTVPSVEIAIVGKSSQERLRREMEGGREN